MCNLIAQGVGAIEKYDYWILYNSQGDYFFVILAKGVLHIIGKKKNILGKYYNYF